MDDVWRVSRQKLFATPLGTFAAPTVGRIAFRRRPLIGPGQYPFPIQKSAENVRQIIDGLRKHTVEHDVHVVVRRGRDQCLRERERVAADAAIAAHALAGLEIQDDLESSHRSS